MKFNYYLLQIVFFLFIKNLSYGQSGYGGSSDPAQLSPLIPSANEMNLGLFKEVPVSGASGIPNISIPIYDIKFRDISIPITIAYHASGIRPDVHPSWVGLGWSLDAGGSISRIMKSEGDEETYPSLVAGYYTNFTTNQASTWSGTANLSGYNIGPTGDGDANYDREPDEFNFSFPGHAGKFFLDQNGAWQVQSDKPLTVKFNGNFIPCFADQVSSGWYQSPLSFEAFTITDEKGYQYCFGTASAIEYSDQLYNPNFYQCMATSWMLKRIVSPDMVDTLEFTYQRGPFQASMFTTFTSSLQCGGGATDHPIMDGQVSMPVYLSTIKENRTGLKINLSASKSNELYYSQTDFNNLATSHGYNAGGSSVPASITTLVTQYFEPSSIHSPSFIPYYYSNPNDLNNPPGAAWQRLIYLKLDTISISDTITNEQLKKVNFVYNNSSTQRLTLSQVKFLAGNSGTVETYGLSYYQNNDANGNPIILPNYNSQMNDHWGFYNNVPLPAFPLAIDETQISTLRAPTDLAHAENGVLQSITYPTGGSTKFEYEQNDYYGTISNGTRILNQSAPGTAGGLRIKKIHTLDNNGNENISTYYYTSSFSNGVNTASLSSSGILQGIPQYNYEVDGVDQAGRQFSQYGFTSSPIYPLTANSSGQHVSYGQVAEQRSDGSYTIFNYTNNDNGSNDLPAVAAWSPTLLRTTPYNDRSFERGQLLEKETFTSGNQPVSQTLNVYQRPSNLDVYAARAVTQNYVVNCDVSNAANSGAVSRIAYEDYYYPFVLSQKTNTTFDQNGQSTSTTTTYNWNFNTKLLSNDEVTNSNGQQFYHNYWYASAQGMQNENMVDYLISKTTDGPTQTSTDTYDYVEWPTSGSGKFYPQDVKRQVTASGNTQTLTTINAYDNYGNIQQQTLKDGMLQSFGWGYNNTMPITEVTNAQNTQNTQTSTVTTTGYLNAAAGGTAIFTTTATGNITIAIQTTGAPSAPFIINYTLNGSGESLCFPFNNASYCGPNEPTSVTMQNMPAGTYTLHINSVTTSSGTVQANLAYTYITTTTTTTGLKEFYCENFEEDPTATVGAAHTGNKFYYAGSSPYTVSWALPNSRSYILNYWYRSGGVWKSATVPYTGTISLSAGDAYDDIRIYPIDSQMSTYTYDMLVGMTSSIDPKGLTSYYYYDNFQRLTDIKDKNGNILKHIDYHYQGQ